MTLTEFNSQPVLTKEVWVPRAENHRSRVISLLSSAPKRLPDGQLHPVWGFLYTYYSFRGGALRRWHPGYGTELCDAIDNYAHNDGYEVVENRVRVKGSFLVHRIPTIRYIAKLLAATAVQPAQLNCFGLHEWAMVYQSTSSIRHSVPLRLSFIETNAVVDEAVIRCTHYDAFRFFTPAARPKNLLQLVRTDQENKEQPGCIHATMDLYKWTYKLIPLLPSEFIADTFELAIAARELDMRASPYDFSHLEFEPIKIETSAGRAEYVREQTKLSAAAAPLRAQLHRYCEQLLMVGAE